MSTAARLSTVLLGAAVLTSGCAAHRGTGPTRVAQTSSAVAQNMVVPDDGGPVLQVQYGAGLVRPQLTLAGLVPLVSVYADGRVIAERPVAAVYPGPALPNLQVGTIPVERVEDLVRQAIDAGVGRDVDYGSPDGADVPATRFSVVTADGTENTEVDALMEAGGEGGLLTPAQLAAREPLQDLFEELTAVGGTATEAYVPDAVAAMVSAEVTSDSPLTEFAAWPGPSLPGDPVRSRSGSEIYCVVARDAAADAVLGAAAGADVSTVWTDPDGGGWALTLRPLLPHESGCEDAFGL